MMIYDLHGLTENEAIIEIDTILWEFEENGYEEIEIITGNGTVLKNLAIEEIEKYGFDWRHPQHNQGSIIVTNN